MKVIFLDIDGVLNSDKWFRTMPGKSQPYPDANIDDGALDMLVKFVNLYNIKLVISSSWRMHTLDDTIIDFKECKLRKLVPYVIDVTPHIWNKGRGDEIDLWLKNQNKEIEFVIIDDDDFDIHQKSHLVKTNNLVGLTVEDLEKCREILKL